MLPKEKPIGSRTAKFFPLLKHILYCRDFYRNNGEGQASRMKRFLKNLFLFTVGGDFYLLIEILYRGYSHWTMFLLGGICFLCLGAINRFLPWETPMPLQMLLGAAIITLLELIMGLIVNVWLGWNVWNYTGRFTLFGQISLNFSMGWYFLSAVGIVLDDFLRYWIFHEEKPRYRFL